MTTIQSSEILQIVRKHGLTTMPQPVRLASGYYSKYFIDGKAALAHGPNLAAACRSMIEAVAEFGQFDAVGGLTLGADQFAHGIALLASQDWFVIRKQPKGRGTNRTIEGAALGAGIRVLLVDDVVTTGGSIRSAYNQVIDSGASVVAATTLVDRGNDAKQFFERVGVPYRPLMTYHDLGIPPVGEETSDDATATPAPV